MQIAQDNAAAPELAVSLPEAGREARSRYADYKVIRRNGAVVGFEPGKISVAMTKAFLAVNGSQGAASARVRELVAGLTEAVVARADAPPAAGRHLPHRGHPGPGRARADALGRARRGARLRALPRGARARRAAQEKRAEAASDAVCTSSKTAQRQPLDLERLRRRCWRRPAKASATPSTRADPRDDAARPLRRRADGRGAQVRDPRRARADREGPGLQLRHRAAAARHHPPRGAGRGGRARPRWQARYAEYFPQFIERGIEAELLDRELAKFDLAALGRALEAERDLQVRLPRPADALRPLLPARAAGGASSCRRPSSCAWRWAWR